MSVSTSAAAPSDKFEENQFMKDLVYLRDTQEAVQSLSGWCIRNRKFAYKISRCWLKCAKKVKTEQKLTLFYLLNDIVQHSKRKNYSDMLEKFEVVVKEVMPHMKEDRISEKILRCLNIWSERQVFPEKLVAELTAIIRSNKAEQDLIDNFQPQHLCTQIKILKALEDDTDYKLKTMKQSDLNLVEMDEGALRQNLKDKQHGSHYISDVDDAKQRLEQYIKAIDREIGKRRQVIELLTHGSKYYEGLLGEAKIVATAYSNFGKRITSNQTKLAVRLANFERTTKPKAAQDSKAASPQLGQSEYVPLGNGRNQEASNHCAPRPQGSGYESKAPHANEEWWNPPAATSWPDPKPDAWVPEHSDDIIPEWKIQAVDEEPSEEESYSQNHALQRLQRNVDTAASCDDYPRSFSAFHSGDHHTNVAVDMDVCSDDDMVTQSNGSQQPRSFSNVQDRLIMMACSSSAYYHNAASLPAGPAPAGVPVHGIPVPPPPPPPPPPPLHIANMSTPPPPPPPAAISFAPPGGVHGGYHRPAVAPRGRSYGIRVRGRGLRR